MFRLITTWIVGIALVVLIAWDIYVVTDKTEEGDSISAVVVSWIFNRPILLIPLGIVVGHFCPASALSEWCYAHRVGLGLSLLILAVIIGHCFWPMKAQ